MPDLRVAAFTVKMVSHFTVKPNLYNHDYVQFRFDGGGAESQAFVVEGMGVALEIFDDMEITRINKKYMCLNLCAL